jgi:MFS family permease
MFDGYETFALILTVGVALRQLLDAALYPQIPLYAGTVIGLTLLGWGIGGIIGGVLADYIGRRRMMIYAILAYSVMTGLSAFAWDWVSFVAFRFLVGIAIGSEWATGSSMTAEMWPDHARGKGAGLMQCGLGIGFFLASFVWLFVGAMGPGAWRYMYILGVLPALLTLWIRTGIPESPLWDATNQQRKAALERQRAGAALAEHERARCFVRPSSCFWCP